MIIRVKKWLMPFGYGLTLYKLIILRVDASNKVLRHEQKHVEQWVRIGLLKFPLFYTIELFKNGYTNNKYEIEARQA